MSDRDNKDNGSGIGFEASPLFTPTELINQLPLSKDMQELVKRGRKRISGVLNGDDPHFLVIAGPCSMHDEQAALEYAKRIAELSVEVDDRVLLVMRAYFEKPRTTVGWKGFINDPDLNETFKIGSGLERARNLLRKIADLGVLTATEFLDPVIPHYIEDLISWVAIGARTTESQTHRQMASALGIPVGFKNGTDGSVQTAVDGILAARKSHTYAGTGPNGRIAVLRTQGNPDGHLVLRGGSQGTNYDPHSVKEARTRLKHAGLSPKLIIDCSHGNSNKDHTKQPSVFKNILEQRVGGDESIVGIMLESNLFPGSQKLEEPLDKLDYGVSITDACVGWEESESLVKWAHAHL